jgi:osmoprotectant transport system substrate-binding protein
MRTTRMLALGASTLALVLSACSTGGSSPSPSAAATASAPAATESAPASVAPSATIASTLTFGGPPECPQREFCAVGLEKVYGLKFKEFKPLDVGGPITVTAVESSQVDVGLLFTSDPSIAAKGFILLDDDKHLQPSDNVAPVVRQAVVDAHPEVKTILEGISAKLTQAELIGINQAVAVDKKDPADAAKEWLTTNGFLPGPGGSGKGKVVVASFNFSESTTLAELYAQALAANGFEPEKKLNLGNREVVFPALKAGQIDVVPEYLATALSVDYKGTPSTDPGETTTAFNTAAKADGLVALAFAAATDQNGFVVTKATADKFGLKALSDLAKPAP